jgi:dipeptidyl aminopeptidase/acylaminoacyl peptidase
MKIERLVEFDNRAGHRLRGMLHRPGVAGEDRPPGVVLLHGFTGDRMESHWLFVKTSRALARMGIASLRFDFFGSGESDGEFREASLETEVADAQDAAAFLRREGGIDGERLGIIGLSLGGAVAALIAEPVRARALVLWSAVAHLPIMRRFAESFARPLPDADGDAEYGGHRVSHRFLDAADRLDPLAGVAAFTGPTLIVHPERDEHLPLTHPADYLRASGAAIKERVIVSCADHTFTSVAWEAEAIGRTVEWFRKNL